MPAPAIDWESLILSIKLASISSALLLIICIPGAWFIQALPRKAKAPIEAISTLPMVLPPTVLGFYLLVFLGPHGWIGQFWQNFSDTKLVFSFSGLVIGSMVYSLPFVLQPILNAYNNISPAAIQLASSLGASPLDRFFTVIIPHSKRGIISAAVLGFAHTLGEFGVVLLIGGNISGETRVVSVYYTHLTLPTTPYV